MRYIYVVFLAAVLFCGGCGGPKVTTKANVDLSDSERSVVHSMLKSVYEKTMEGKIIAYYDETLYMMPQASGDFSNAFSKDAPRLEKPIHTLSIIYSSTYTVMNPVDFEPYVQAVTCETHENGKTQKYKITDFKIIFQPNGGGGSMMMSYDKMMIIPLQIQITETGSGDSKSNTSSAVKTTGSQGEALSDGVAGVCLDEVAPDYDSNPVTGTTTDVLHVKYTISNLSGKAISFDKIEVTFSSDGKQYAKSVTVQSDKKDQYMVYYLEPYHEATTPFNLDASCAETFMGGTGGDPYVRGQNQMIVRIYSGKTLVHGPFTIDFEAK